MSALITRGMRFPVSSGLGLSPADERVLRLELGRGNITDPVITRLLNDLDDARRALSAPNAETDRYRTTMVKMAQMIQSCCRGNDAEELRYLRDHTTP